MMTAAPNRSPRIRIYEPRGAAHRLYSDFAPEVVIDGPAGTGKSRGVLEYVDYLLREWPAARALIIRKTLTSLTASGLVTFREKVLAEARNGVRFFSGSRERPAQYEYPNGSVLVVGGMDRPDKVLSTEYDLIYVQECTELTEGEWETLSTRLRNGVLPAPQLLGDCNPGPPTHWLKRREREGRLAMWPSRHRDNPLYWDADRDDWTPDGAAYIARLDALTGVRKKRLRGGIWAAAEGLVYEAWDHSVHVIQRHEVPGAINGEIPPQWPRDWAIDFGYRNPFVWQEWAESPDGRLYLVREIYRTGRLVEDHARLILSLCAAPAGVNGPNWTNVLIRPRSIICDHDAEDRATFARHIGLPTLPAYKAIRAGIQAVEARLRVDGSGRAALYILADALVEPPDPALIDASKPTRTAEEFDSYVWDVRDGKPPRELPVDEDNHGMDALRYRVATRDRRAGSGSSAFDAEGRRIA